MKTHYAVTLAMLAGAAIGATAVNGLRAQAKPPLYLVTEIDVSSPEAYGKEYAPKAQALTKAAGGRFLAIGGTAGAGAGKVTAFDGDAPKRATVQVWTAWNNIKLIAIQQRSKKPGRSVKNMRNSIPSPSRASHNNARVLPG
jgi:Domain of unknown function (DUF1330)